MNEIKFKLDTGSTWNFGFNKDRETENTCLKLFQNFMSASIKEGFDAHEGRCYKTFGGKLYTQFRELITKCNDSFTLHITEQYSSETQTDLTVEFNKNVVKTSSQTRHIPFASLIHTPSQCTKLMDTFIRAQLLAIAAEKEYDDSKAYCDDGIWTEGEFRYASTYPSGFIDSAREHIDRYAKECRSRQIEIIIHKKL